MRTTALLMVTLLGIGVLSHAQPPAPQDADPRKGDLERLRQQEKLKWQMREVDKGGGARGRSVGPLGDTGDLLQAIRDGPRQGERGAVPSSSRVHPVQRRAGGR